MAYEKPESPALTSAALEPHVPTDPQEIVNRRNALREGAVLFDESIQAKPLALPGKRFRILNNNVSFRWINCGARGGMQVARMKAVGFEVAKATDIVFPGGDLPLTDGVFKNGDLLLMKIDKQKYLGALKNNALTAQDRVSRRGIAQTANAALRGRIHIGGDMSLNSETSAVPGTLSEVNAPQALKDKIVPFIPGEGEVRFSPDPEVK